MKKELADFKPDVSTVMLVPHTKKNGKLSKRKHDIQLRDADGNVFTLTKKDMKKALKEQRKNAEGRTDGDKPTWKKYVKAAEEGRLTPEDVAQFFKEEKPNLGADKKMENKSQEVTKTVKAEKPKAPISDVPFKIAVARQTLRGG